MSRQFCIPCNGTIEYQDATDHRNEECKLRNILLGIMPEANHTHLPDHHQLKYLTDGQKTGGFWHSRNDPNQWAKVTFKQRSVISQVKVTNRCGCDFCAPWLTGARVYIGQSADADAEVQCGGPIPTTGMCNDAVLECNIEGDYVVIRKEPSNPHALNIVELEAHGKQLPPLLECRRIFNDDDESSQQMVVSATVSANVDCSATARVFDGLLPQHGTAGGGGVHCYGRTNTFSSPINVAKVKSQHSVVSVSVRSEGAQHLSGIDDPGDTCCGSAAIVVNGVEIIGVDTYSQRGYNVVHLDPYVSKLDVKYKSFDTNACCIEELRAYLYGIPPGSLVLVAVQDDARQGFGELPDGTTVTMSEAAKQVNDFFAALGATTTAVGYRGSFALAGFTQGAATTSVDGGFQWSARGDPGVEFTLNIPIPHRVDLDHGYFVNANSTLPTVDQSCKTAALHTGPTTHEGCFASYGWEKTRAVLACNDPAFIAGDDLGSCRLDVAIEQRVATCGCACIKLGFDHFALEDSNVCFCGQGHPTSSRAQGCSNGHGGPFRMDVYSYAKVTDDSEKEVIQVNLVPSMLTFSKTTCADALVAFPSYVNLQCSNVGNDTFLTIDQQFCSPIVANINAALYSALTAATSTTTTATTIPTKPGPAFSSRTTTTLYPPDAGESDQSDVDASGTVTIPSNTSSNASSGAVDDQSSNAAGTVVPVLLVLLCLIAAGAAVLHYRKSRLSTARAEAARELDGAQAVEMINNPMHNDANSNNHDVVASNDDGDATPATSSPIYDPPACVPPAQDLPAYYSSVAAAPKATADYAAPNELGGSALYEGRGDGVDDSAAMYASPTEGGAVYAAGRADAYAPVMQTGKMYAPSVAGGGWDDAAVYSNDAYGNVAGSTTNA